MDSGVLYQCTYPHSSRACRDLRKVINSHYLKDGDPGLISLGNERFAHVSHIDLVFWISQHDTRPTLAFAPASVQHQLPPSSASGSALTSINSTTKGSRPNLANTLQLILQHHNTNWSDRVHQTSWSSSCRASSPWFTTLTDRMPLPRF